MKDNPLKISIVAAVGVILAILFGFALDGLYRLGSGGYLVMAGLAALLFLAWFMIQALTLTDKKVALPLLAAETILLAVAAYRNFSLIVFGVLLLAFYFLYIGYRRTRYTAQNDLKIAIIKLSKRVLPLAATALALIVAIVYVGVLSVGGDIISRQEFTPLIRPAGIILSWLIPGFAADKPVDEVIGSLFKSNLVSGFLPERIKDLPLEQREALLAETGAELRKSVGNNLGVSIAAQDTASDVLYNFFVGRFQEFPQTRRGLLVIAVAIAVLILVRSVMVIVGWLAQWLAWAVYQLLLALKFIKIESEPKEKETIKI